METQLDDKLKYVRGDVVKIQLPKEVSDKCDLDKQIWLECFVEKANEEAKTYSLQVSDHTTYGIEEHMTVKEDLVQPLFLTKDVEFLLAEGYSREEVFHSLDVSKGDLDDALLFLHRHDRMTMSEESEKLSSISNNHGRSSNSASQPSSNSSVIKEFRPSAKQRESTSRNSSGTALQVNQISAAYRKTSFCDDVQIRGKITLRPREDEFDYTVVFEKTPLGLEIHPCANNRNACIGKTLNEFSNDNVYKGSLVLDCNDVWLLGQSTVYIQQCIKAEAQTTPVTITFRAKKWMTSVRARNLRKSLEKSRTKRAKSLTLKKKARKWNDHARAHSDNFLSPRSCTSSFSPKIVRVRLPPSQRRDLRKAVKNPELRLFVVGGKTEFGITHITAKIKNCKTLSTKKYNPSQTQCFGECLTWDTFTNETASHILIKALSLDKVVGSARLSIPILPCTLTKSVKLRYNGTCVGTINVKLTHIR